MQNHAMREYAARRGWTVALQIREVGSGAAKREAAVQVARPMFFATAVDTDDEMTVLLADKSHCLFAMPP